MTRGGWRALTGSLLLAIPIFPIPGLVGRTISVGGVARTSTGGAVIAATMNGGNEGANRHVAIARLNVDGTVDLAYGSRGIASAGLASGARATAVAINPATGAAWVGVRTRSGASEVVALDGNGRRVSSFGRGGVVRLPRLGAAPTALAWRPRKLVVAGGAHVALLDPASGRVGSSFDAMPGAGCAITAISSAVFSVNAWLLGAVVRGPSSCGTIVHVTTHGISYEQFVGAHSVTLAGSGTHVCLAASSARAITIGPGLVKAPAGRLIALDSLGAGACAALIYPAAGRAPVVVQTARNSHRTTTMLSHRFQPLAMSRCNQHLLVIGDQPGGGRRRGAVAVVPVREGPHAIVAAVSAAAGQSASGRCRPAH